MDQKSPTFAILGKNHGFRRHNLKAKKMLYVSFQLPVTILSTSSMDRKLNVKIISWDFSTRVLIQLFRKAADTRNISDHKINFWLSQKMPSNNKVLKNHRAEYITL